MSDLLLRFLTPMTWLLWIVIGIGMIEHFFLEPRGRSLLPSGVFDTLLIVMWPSLLAVWFGWKEKEKRKAREGRDEPPAA
jgi:hypothetical protein